jgi:poly(3-hydroxyalkanoate) depolymerase
MSISFANRKRAPMSGDDEPGSAAIDVTMVDVGKQPLRVAIKRGSKHRPPLLMFNGIGASLEIAKPFMSALKRTEAILFDVPGVGGSPLPASPYRPSTIARLASQLMVQLGHREVDVCGVSWGGGMAQQFAHQHYGMCRKIVLAATSPGALMIPAHPRVLWKMATPRRYTDKDFMRQVAPEIYGGAFRRDPDLSAALAKGMTGATDRGYLYQLLAMTGWTSLPWLWTLKQPTLILAGRDDPIVPPINGRLMAWLMPNAKLKLLDEGHLFLVTSPVESAAIIEAFLAE